MAMSIYGEMAKLHSYSLCFAPSFLPSFCSIVNVTCINLYSARRAMHVA